jgi:hypothetical protein
MSPPESGAAAVRQMIEGVPELTERDLWLPPDMSVLRLYRRVPPELPISVFGAEWGPWVTTAAEAAACPPDYVVGPLLSIASALIGHARWAAATVGWRLRRRARNVRSRLGGGLNLIDPLPEKPRGMHARTYARLALRAQEAEARSLRLLITSLDRLNRRA